MSEILRDEVALAYDVWSKCYDRNDNPTRDISLKVLQSDFVEKELNKIEKLQILEVGCGTGRNTEFLIEKFSPKISNYVALDISDGMMEIARQKIKNLSSDHSTASVTFSNVDIATYPWPFDACCLFNFVFGCLVLEHLKNLKNHFREVSRVVAKGGLLFVCELHPMKQILGSKARLESQTSSKLIASPPCFNHDVSEYLQSALATGFELVNVREDRDEAAQPTDVPRLISFMFKKI